jgi:hypothetical protein
MNQWFDMDLEEAISIIANIKICKKIGGLHGDYLFLLKDRFDLKYGYLVAGYGSCSGCDEFKHLQVYEDSLDGFIKFLKEKERCIIWNHADDMIDYFKNKKWEDEFFWNDEDSHYFVSESLKLMEGK